MASQQALLTKEPSLQTQEPPFFKDTVGIRNYLITDTCGGKKMEEEFLPEKLLGAHSICINILENLNKSPSLLSLKSAQC